MKIITQEAWTRVHLKALEAANAALRSDSIMVKVHYEQMLNLLDEMDAEFGPQAAMLATRADYTEDMTKRRKLFEEALMLARSHGDRAEEAEILDSLQKLSADE